MKRIYTLAELEAMPTISQSQFDDLKIENTTQRVWLSRMTVIAFAVLLAVVIHFWSNAIVNHSIKVVPEINSNLA